MDILLNKSYKEYDSLSRYASFPYYYHSKDNKYVYGTTAYLNENTPYIVHNVQKNDTLDNLALKYYGNPTYYWIIADFNRITDAFSKLQEGKILRIPVFSSIEFQR